MDRLELDDALRTGDPVVDEQHLAIIGLFNQVHEAQDGEAGAAEISTLIQRLHDYTIEHFVAEQELMSRGRVPQAELLSHIEEHDVLTQRVRELVLEYRSDGMTSAVPLATLLQEWLCDHIQERDRRAVEHMRANGFIAG